MVITLGAVFSLNLFCNFISCEPRLKSPEILPINYNIHDDTNYNSTINLLVKTNSGWIEGYRMRTINGRNIGAFEGIPYGEPPLGFYRFRSAIPKYPWNGVKPTKRLSQDCLQLNLRSLLRVIGSEDCLYLNIYKPDNSINDTSKIYPVLVFLQGGSYYFGSSGDLGPTYLLEQDIILITMNFRVGVLGFLSTGDKYSPGNYGLKDQSLALKWIYENIYNFGGDPNRIILGGHSSGGSSSHLHMMSNKSKYYFQSGISLSGTGFTHWAIKKYNNQSNHYTKTIGKYLQCPIQNNNELIECLRHINPNVLVASQLILLEFIPFPVTLFGPVIESDGPDAFITQTPYDYYFKYKSIIKKPWIFSMTSQEGYLALLLLSPILGLPRLLYNWKNLAPIMMDYKYTGGNDTLHITNKLSSFYFGNNYNINSITHEQITQVFGDRMFLYGVHKAIKYHSMFAPTYAYMFDYKGQYNVGNIIGFKTSDFGISHSEDLYYYFNSSQYNGFSRNDPEYKLSQIMINLISTFASTGKPNFTMKNKNVTQIWEPVNSNNIRFLLFNNSHIGMIHEPFLGRLKFWNELSLREKIALDL